MFSLTVVTECVPYLIVTFRVAYFRNVVKLTVAAVTACTTIPAQTDCFTILGIGWGGIVPTAHFDLSGCFEVRVQQEYTRCAPLKTMPMLFFPVRGVIDDCPLPLMGWSEAGHRNQAVDIVQGYFQVLIPHPVSSHGGYVAPRSVSLVTCILS